MNKNNAHEHECRIRNYYAENLIDFRQDEKLIGKEKWYAGSRVRVDMRSVDKFQVIREWEFKIHADYEALGQILTYVSLARMNSNFDKKIQGVIAAFTFQPEIVTAVEVMNLGIELIELPTWLARAGDVPLILNEQFKPVNIPKMEIT